jgi:pyrophosphate--fructose-6-phosphate 1-phosphotransferase
VVTGLFDFLAERAPGSTLLGFISGTKGLFEQSSLELTSSLLESYRNQVRIYSLYSIIPHRLIQAFTH